jgi:hypothetical protein
MLFCILYFKERFAFIEGREIMKQEVEYLQMVKYTIYKLTRTGFISSLKVAGQWQFKKDVIDEWISEQSLERATQNIKFISEEKRKDKISYG